MSNPDGIGLGVIDQDGGDTAPVNTGLPAQSAAPVARRSQALRPGTGLEWIPRMLPGKGLGDDTTIALVARMVVNGALGALTGVAMAPRDQRVKYGVTGGLLGFLIGPIGIAGQAVYVIAKE